MLTPRGNKWNSRNLPSPGSLGYITDGTDRYGKTLYWYGKKMLWQVIAYPLCDSALYRGRHFSAGIHTLYCKCLETGEIRKFAYQYFNEA